MLKLMKDTKKCQEKGVCEKKPWMFLGFFVFGNDVIVLY